MISAHSLISVERPIMLLLLLSCCLVMSVRGKVRTINCVRRNLTAKPRPCVTHSAIHCHLSLHHSLHLVNRTAIFLVEQLQPLHLSTKCFINLIQVNVRLIQLLILLTHILQFIFHSLVFLLQPNQIVSVLVAFLQSIFKFLLFLKNSFL